MALRQGRAHLGGSHMLDPETNTYNVPFIKRYLADVPLNSSTWPGGSRD